LSVTGHSIKRWPLIRSQTLTQQAIANFCLQGPEMKSDGRIEVTNRAIQLRERCFVEVRRRTRPMVCLVNVERVDRIIYSIFQRFTWNGKTAR
jgi:hypothetical protein